MFSAGSRRKPNRVRIALHRLGQAHSLAGVGVEQDGGKGVAPVLYVEEYPIRICPLWLKQPDTSHKEFFLTGLEVAQDPFKRASRDQGKFFVR
mgnify:CR=1 FL=1